MYNVIAVVLAASAFLLGFTAALAGTHFTAPSQGDTVQVYDNVIPESARDILHIAASKSGLGHKVFTRPISNPGQHPAIERALDAILSELGDEADDENKQYVEYWTRQEWRHIEAHADVDEHLAKYQDKAILNGEMDLNQVRYRYPKNGHVLYLKIGNQVRGPTCIFPDVQSGGDLLTGADDQIKETNLVTVPAVNGRLLRFEGNALHSVPRPADLWFLSFVRGAPEHAPEDEWGRSVILFNTWMDEPPKDVPLHETIPEDDLQSLVNDANLWTKVFPKEDDDHVCNTEIIEEKGLESDKALSKVKIWLLGNDRRRNHQMRTVNLAAKSAVKEAFLEQHTVTNISLH